MLVECDRSPPEGEDAVTDSVGSKFSSGSIIIVLCVVASAVRSVYVASGEYRSNPP
jgi:hypothetical protein